MQLNILKALIADYSKDLAQQKDLNQDHFWEIANNWRTHWDVEAPDFVDMFDKCLHSNISRKLWKDDGGDAKTMLMSIMRLDPEFSRRMFKGLLNVDKELSIRISHFQFGCEVLMEEFKNQNRSSNLTDHFHNGPYYPMLYLFFHQPELYCPYFHGAVLKFMEKVKAFPAYEAADVERFQKVVKTMRHFLEGNEEIMQRFPQLVNVTEGVGIGNFLVMDFLLWSGHGG